MSTNPLPVEASLECRKYGMDQTIKPGDWYYDLSMGREPIPAILNRNYDFRKPLLHDSLVRIPTLPDLLSFVREKAGVFLFGPAEEGYWMAMTTPDVVCKAPTPELALLELLKKMEGE